MAKTKIGSIRQIPIFEGDVNLLKQGELLISFSDEYPTIRKRTADGIKTFIVVPLEDITEAPVDDTALSEQQDGDD